MRCICPIVLVILTACAGGVTDSGEGDLHSRQESISEVPKDAATEGVSVDSTEGPDGIADAPSTTCAPPTPFSLDGNCVECLESGQCGETEVCDPANHTCVEVVPEECAFCQGTLASCVQIDGIWTCVECADDEDCGLGEFCAPKSFVCSPLPNPEPGVCSEDSSCQPSESMELSLQCDQETGTCFDTFGWCDGIYALCKTGSTCAMLSGVSDVELVYKLPAGGTPESVGFCSCVDTIGFLDVGPCYDTDDSTPCPETTECFTGTCNGTMMLGIEGDGIFEGFCVVLTGYVSID